MANVLIGSKVLCGPDRPLCYILGPCVIEPGSITMDIACAIADIARVYNLPVVFKASFDKANRTSGKSYRGPGLDEGLDLLLEVKRATGLPVMTDVHEIWQVLPAAEVCDILQIPAMLCRQTDLIATAARTGLPINVKKSQSMAAWDVPNIIAKIVEAGNQKAIITERGTSFGYNNLVCDMRSLPIMRSYGCPVIFDATHSVQTPGGRQTCSGGDSAMVPVLARAAVAAGCDGLFLETHLDPEKSLSDGPCMIALHDLARLIECCAIIKNAVDRDSAKYTETSA